jgi:hypothetical protein
VPLLAVAVVLIGLLSTVDLLLTITGTRGIRAHGDQPDTADAGQMQPAATTLRPVAAFGGQSAKGDVIDSAA